MRTIKFQGYGFNEYDASSADQADQFYLNHVIKLENYGDQYELRLFATVDLGESLILWKFTTIDKSTGDLPDNAEMGFLPMRNETHGKGFSLQSGLV